MKQILDRLHQAFNEKVYAPDNYSGKSMFDARLFDLYIRPQAGLVRESSQCFRAVDAVLGDTDDAATGGGGSKASNMSSDTQSILIMADPGYGKTLLGIQIAHTLLKQQQWHQPDIEAPIIPIWGYLPSFTNDTEVLKKGLLEAILDFYQLNHTEIAELKTACQAGKLNFLVILDGFDEIQINDPAFLQQHEGLYASNQWFEQWPGLRAITLTRPEAFSNLKETSSYQRLFYPNPAIPSEGFEEIWLQPFSKADIMQYITNYTTHLKLAPTEQVWDKPDIYIETLEKIHPLSELAQSPFILSIMVQALPQIAQEASAQEDYLYTRERVYNIFVVSWLTKQAKQRIWQDPARREKLLGVHINTPELLTKVLQNYAENLARYMWVTSEGKLETPLNNENTLIKDLFQDLPDPGNTSEEVLMIIRSGCILQCYGNTWRFLHKTITEYLAVHALFTSVHVEVDAMLQQADGHMRTEFSFNQGNIQKEKSMLLFMVDKIQTDETFKQLLYQTVTHSRENPLIAQAAANAITALNYAGEIFNDRDFSGVHIPGADMTGAICDSTNFADANLSDVMFANAWLHNTNLSKANLSNIATGLLPKMKNPNNTTLRTMAIDQTNALLYAGDDRGKVIVWDLNTFEIKKILYLSRKGWSDTVIENLGILGGMLPVYRICLSPSGQRIACLFGSGKYMYTYNYTRGLANYIKLAEVSESARHPSSYGTLSFTDEKHVIHFQHLYCYETGQYYQHPFSDIIVSNDPNKKYTVCVKKLDQSNQFQIELYDTKELIRAIKQGDIATCKVTAHLVTIQNTYEHWKDIIIRFGEGHKILSISTRLWRALESNKRGAHITIFRQNKQKQWKRIRVLQSYQSRPDISIINRFMGQNKFVLCLCNNSVTLWHIESGKRYTALPWISYSQESLTVYYQKQNQAFLLLEDCVYALQLSLIQSFETRKSLQQPFDQGSCLAQRDIFYNLERPLSIRGNRQLTVTNKELRSRPHFAGILGTEEISAISISLTNDSSMTAGKIIQFLYSEFAQSDHYQRAMIISNTGKFGIYADIGSNNEEFRNTQVTASGLIKFFVHGRAYVTNPRLYVLNLTHGQHIYTLSHHNPIACLAFSTDDTWLLTGGFTARLWDMQNGRCLHRFGHDVIKSHVVSLAINEDKTFIAIFDGKRNLTIFETRQFRIIFQLNDMMQVFTYLNFTADGQYIYAETDTDNKCIYQIIPTSSHLITLKAIERSTATQLYCNRSNIHQARFNNPAQVQLFRQGGAKGQVIIPDPADDLIYNGELLANHYHPQAIIEETVYSLVKQRLPVTYDNWSVALMRKSGSTNSEHAFIFLEGLDAMGKRTLIRFDLATSYFDKVADQRVKTPSGKAKTLLRVEQSINDQEHLYSTLTKMLKISHSDDIAYKYAYKVWSINREEALKLYSWHLRDHRAGLQAYSLTGKQSLFGRHKHNCYTYARTQLLKLRNAQIKSDLPFRWFDFIAADPRNHLIDAGASHVRVDLDEHAFSTGTGSGGGGGGGGAKYDP